MKLIIAVSLLTAIITACSSTTISHSEILSAYSKIDVSDGVNDDEMKLIAQHYLIVTSDEPCKSDVTSVHLASPQMKCGWVQPEKNDHGCYIGFPKKSLLESVPLYVKVSAVTGAASCAGYLILK